MASAQGSAVVDFGAAFTDLAIFVVTGQASILATSKVEAWIDPTQAPAVPAANEHSADEHIYAEIDCRCRDIVAGVGFTIVLRARGSEMYFGKFAVSWCWSD